MTTMLEKAALALANTDRTDAGLSAITDADQIMSLDHYIQRARAALQAIREVPTEFLETVFADGEDPAYREDFSAVIDAILSDGEA